MRGRGLAVMDSAAAYAASALLAVAASCAALSLRGSDASEKAKGAVAVLVLACAATATAGLVSRFSLGVSFMLRAPVPVAAFAMTTIVSEGAGMLLRLALVPIALAVLTAAVRLMDEAQSRPVSHL